MVSGLGGKFSIRWACCCMICLASESRSSRRIRNSSGIGISSRSIGATLLERWGAADELRTEWDADELRSVWALLGARDWRSHIGAVSERWSDEMDLGDSWLRAGDEKEIRCVGGRTVGIANE